jgi:hypothetical protein
MAFPTVTTDATKTVASRESIVQVTISAAATPLLVQFVDFDGSLDLRRLMFPGASNGPAYVARIWEASRGEILKVKTKEVKKVLTLLGSFTGKKDGTCTAYIRDVDDISTKAALLSDDFACTIYRDPATVGFGNDAAEVTLCIESRKDGAIAWTQDATA